MRVEEEGVDVGVVEGPLTPGKHPEHGLRLLIVCT